MGKVDFAALDDTEFEEFCFELLHEVGFVNVDWRKGTPLPSSPADSGRDIVAQWERTDPDGSKHLDTWFVDCKHYAKAVPPEALQGLLAWAHAERPHTVLVVACGIRSQSEILAAESEFYDRVWHERSLVFIDKVRKGEKEASKDILDFMEREGEKLRSQHPEGTIRPVESDFEWGMWNGKLSALRWVLGDEWDFLDT